MAETFKAVVIFCPSPKDSTYFKLYGKLDKLANNP